MRPYYSDEIRLDRLVSGLERDERIRITAEAFDILTDIYCQGYAHRDFHAKNLYCVEGALVLTDFETLLPYGSVPAPKLCESYDVTGKGLPSPFKTGNMGMFSESPDAISKQLDVTLEETLAAFNELLKQRLLDACRTFSTASGRHNCRAERIYSSFALSRTEVTPAEAQRDSQKRFAAFGVVPSDIEGRSFLDLGCNVGGMLFEAQRMRPSRAVGVEIDDTKVRVARAIAALNDVNAKFVCADLDRLGPEMHADAFDVVSCLSINRHVRSAPRLFELLGRLTRDLLLFEGNAGTDCASVANDLRRNGFRQVEYLGMCQDDCLPENNIRPLFRASK